MKQSKGFSITSFFMCVVALCQAVTAFAIYKNNRLSIEQVCDDKFLKKKEYRYLLSCKTETMTEMLFFNSTDRFEDQRLAYCSVKLLNEKDFQKNPWMKVGKKP